MYVRRTLALTMLVVSLLSVPTPVAAESVTGTVTVENGTADGDRVTVTPITRDRKRAGESVNATVHGASFSVTGLPEAPLYFIKVLHDGTAHYALVENDTSVHIDLSARVSGRLVTENGTARAGVRLMLTSRYGPLVADTTTGPNGTFSFGLLQPNHTYHLRYFVRGIPYNRTIRTGSDGGRYTVVLREPTDDRSVLEATGGSPASHVVRILPAENRSGVLVVETMTLTNRVNRPFVGTVTVRLPPGVNATAAMYEGTAIPTRQTNRTVRIGATIPSGGTVSVGVAYRLRDGTLNRTLRYGADVAAVVLRGYDLSRVAHSETLSPSDAPIPMLVTRNVTDERQIWVSLPERPQARDDLSGGGSDSAFDAPSRLLLGGIGVSVVGALAAYRLL
ncbi:MAG: carboxypeptidase-like regulatory domain-containing protein [Halodesulfurarchaeum sp.]